MTRKNLVIAKQFVFGYKEDDYYINCFISFLFQAIVAVAVAKG